MYRELKSTGLIAWINKDFMPSYVKDIIDISSRVFDRLYIITDYPKVKNHDNVIYLNANPVRSHIFNMSEVYDLKYQEITDYIAYNPINILHTVYNINIDSVFTFDTDLIPYNKYLINQISQNITNKPFVATEKSYDLNKPNEYFYNCSLTFFNTTEESYSLSNLLTRELIRVIKDRDHEYLATGPDLLTMVSHRINLRWSDYINISVDTLKPTMPKIIQMKDDKLGLHLEMSTYNKNKLQGKNDIRVKINKDNLIELIY